MSGPTKRQVKIERIAAEVPTVVWDVLGPPPVMDLSRMEALGRRMAEDVERKVLEAMALPGQTRAYNVTPNGRASAEAPSQSPPPSSGPGAGTG